MLQQVRHHTDLQPPHQPSGERAGRGPTAWQVTNTSTACHARSSNDRRLVKKGSMPWMLMLVLLLSFCLSFLLHCMFRLMLLLFLSPTSLSPSLWSPSEVNTFLIHKQIKTWYKCCSVFVNNCFLFSRIIYYFSQSWRFVHHPGWSSTIADQLIKSTFMCAGYLWAVSRRERHCWRSPECQKGMWF